MWKPESKRKPPESKFPDLIVDGTAPPITDAAIEALAKVVEVEEAGGEAIRHQYKRTHPTWTCRACGRVETDPREIGTRSCPG